MKIPCEKCLTLAICLSTFSRMPGPIALMVLSLKCSLMKNYIYDVSNLCMMDKACEVEKFFNFVLNNREKNDEDPL